MPTPSQDAETIASVAVDGLLGVASVGIVEGIKLRAAYARVMADPAAKVLAVERFAELLTKRNAAVATQLCDSLAAKVGR